MPTIQENFTTLMKPVRQGVSSHIWLHSDTSATTSTILAEQLAHLIVEYALSSPDLYESWINKRQGLDHTNGTDRKVLEAHLAVLVGTDTETPPRTQLEGGIAEFLWYFTHIATDSKFHSRVRLEGPSFSPLDHGGDGIGIYRTGEGTYLFRLWEIKKHTSSTNPMVKEQRSIDQLNGKAEQYLAQYAVVLSRSETDPQLATFYAKLVEHWIKKTSSVSIGISITSNQIFPDPSFTRMATSFAGLTNSDCFTGLSIYIPNFPDFADIVRGEILKGVYGS